MPIEASIFIGLIFGYGAFLSASSLFRRMWAGIVAGAACLALSVAGAMLDIIALNFTAYGLAVALFIIFLIKNKITKG